MASVVASGGVAISGSFNRWQTTQCGVEKSSWCSRSWEAAWAGVASRAKQANPRRTAARTDRAVVTAP